MNSGKDSNCVHWLYAVLTSTSTSMDSVMVPICVLSLGCVPDMYPDRGGLHLDVPPEWSGFALRQRFRGRSLQDAAVGGEARTVQRAVPRLLGVVPRQHAAEVRADAGDRTRPSVDRRDGGGNEAGPADDALALGGRRRHAERADVQDGAGGREADSGIGPHDVEGA